MARMRGQREVSMGEMRLGGLGRGAKIASFSLGVAGRAAAAVGKRAVGADKDSVSAKLIERTAEEMFAVLGELKGGAMKFGQALSVMEAAIPVEFAEPFRLALGKLQNQAPPLPAKKIHGVLDAQLGTRWRERFQFFDDRPAAAASIGQVHKGMWSDGRQVAVKIQYPGIDYALRSDLKILARMSGVFAKAAPGIDMQAFIAEYIRRTEAELNYRQEADIQRMFAQAFADDPSFYIPKVLASSPKVIVSEWVEGLLVGDIIASGEQDLRNLAAERLCEFVLAAPGRTGFLHGDPHPGNFVVLPDGRMAVLDFGAAAPFSETSQRTLGALGLLAFEDDDERLIEGLWEIDFLAQGKPLDANEIRKQIDLFVSPVRGEHFHVSRDWFATAIAPYIGLRDKNSPVACISPPKEFLMFARVFGGAFAISAQLDATIPYNAVMARQLTHFLPA